MTHEASSSQDLREVIAAKADNELTQEELGQCGSYLVNRITQAYNIRSWSDFQIGSLSFRGLEGGYELTWSTSSGMYDDSAQRGFFRQRNIHEQGSRDDDRALFPLRQKLHRELEIDDPDDYSDEYHRSRRLTGVKAFEAFNKVLDKTLPRPRA